MGGPLIKKEGGVMKEIKAFVRSEKADKIRTGAVDSQAL